MNGGRVPAYYSLAYQFSRKNSKLIVGYAKQVVEKPYVGNGTARLPKIHTVAMNATKGLCNLTVVTSLLDIFAVAPAAEFVPLGLNYNKESNRIFLLYKVDIRYYVFNITARSELEKYGWRLAIKDDWLPSILLGEGFKTGPRKIAAPRITPTRLAFGYPTGLETYKVALYSKNDGHTRGWYDF